MRQSRKFQDLIEKGIPFKLNYNQTKYVLEMELLSNRQYRSYFEDEALYKIVMKKDISDNQYLELIDMESLKLKYQFTPRERQVVDCIYRGMSNGHISQELKISESTVKKHVWNIFNKVGVDSRMDLIFTLK